LLAVALAEDVDDPYLTIADDYDLVSEDAVVVDHRTNQTRPKLGPLEVQSFMQQLMDGDVDSVCNGLTELGILKSNDTQVSRQAQLH
jgi:hypothetical protein